MSRIIGHYAPWLLATLVGVLIALTLVPAFADFVPWQVMVLVFAAVVLLAVAIFVHNRRLCDLCIAAMPLDASTVASRYAVRFAVAHLFEQKGLAFGYLGVIVASSFLSDHPIGKFGWAAAEASLVYLLFVYVTHQRLQPWCPQCKNGGEEVAAPTTPTPVSSNV
jgi:hypothetical protein